jgi:hypothetical protein
MIRKILGSLLVITFLLGWGCATGAVLNFTYKDIVDIGSRDVDLSLTGFLTFIYCLVDIIYKLILTLGILFILYVFVLGLMLKSDTNEIKWDDEAKLSVAITIIFVLLGLVILYM